MSDAHFTWIGIAAWVLAIAVAIYVFFFNKPASALPSGNQVTLNADSVG